MFKSLMQMQDKQRLLMKGGQEPHGYHGKFKNESSGQDAKSGIKDATWHHKGSQVELREHPEGDVQIEERNGKWDRRDGKTPTYTQTDSHTHHFPSIKEAARHLSSTYGIDYKPVRAREVASEPKAEPKPKEEASVQSDAKPVAPAFKAPVGPFGEKKDGITKSGFDVDGNRNPDDEGK